MDGSDRVLADAGGVSLKSKAVDPSARGAATTDEDKKTNRMLIRRLGISVVRFMAPDVEIHLKHSSTPVSKSDNNSDIFHSTEDKVHASGAFLPS